MTRILSRENLRSVRNTDTNDFIEEYYAIVRALSITR